MDTQTQIHTQTHMDTYMQIATDMDTHGHPGHTHKDIHMKTLSSPVLIVEQALAGCVQVTEPWEASLKSPCSSPASRLQSLSY